MYSSKRMNLGSLLKEQRDPAGPDPRKTLTMLWGSLLPPLSTGNH